MELIKKELLNKGNKYQLIFRRTLFERFNYVCQGCNVKCVYPNDINYNDDNCATIDHIKPISKGGDHTYINTQLLCRMCNSIKRDNEKYFEHKQRAKQMDDCYKNGKKIPCAFQAFSSYNAMVQGWADVLNLPRYKNCKRFMLAKYNRGMSAKEIVDATCKCFYKSGYHTSNLWKVRSNLSTEYWTVKASFPSMEY